LHKGQRFTWGRKKAVYRFPISHNFFLLSVPLEGARKAQTGRKKAYKLLPQAEGDLRNNEVICPQLHRESVSELEDLCCSSDTVTGLLCLFKMNWARWAFGVN